MTLSLKSNVFVSSFDQGVVFRGDGEPVIFRGKKAYQLFRLLEQAMVQSTSAENAVDMLPEPIRVPARQLFEQLTSHGFVRSRAEDDEAVESELNRDFQGLWNYLLDHHLRPGAAWKHWQKTVVAVHGDARGREIALKALRACGIDRAVDIAQHAAPDSDALQLVASGDTPLDELVCDARDAWIFGPLNGHLVLGRSFGDAATAIEQWKSWLRPSSLGALSFPASRLAVAAGMLAFDAFKTVCGTAPTGFEIASVLDPSYILRPLLVRTERPAEDDAPPALSDAQRVLAAEPLFDRDSGILEYGPDERQIPLSVVHVRVATPAGLEHVTGWGLTYDEARARAIARALGCYAGTLEPAQNAAGVGVAWSRESAVARALGPVEAALRELPLSALTSMDARKLAKVAEMLSGEFVQISAAPADGRATVIARAGIHTAQATDATVEGAAYEALGDMCCALQLGVSSGLPSPAQGLTSVLPVDLGFAALRNVICCRIAR